MTVLLGIDVGTTHAKAGTFRVEDGQVIPLRAAVRENITSRALSGATVYDPDTVWNAVSEAVHEVTTDSATDPTGIGISSMAETGLLVDRTSGTPRTPLIPWFERCAATEAAQIAERRDPFEHFRRTGLRANAKAGLAKLLWLRERGEPLNGAVWLSAADYVAYRLTGAFGTDPTLAVRTHAFDLSRSGWDAAWLESWHLSPSLFPTVLPTGTVVGKTRAGTGIVGAEVPVAIAGHDHVCGAFAAGVAGPGTAFDSMGTAETLVGTFEARPLTEADFATGLIFGPYVQSDRLFWMSALSASGGSVEWLRGLLADPPLTYAQLDALLNETPAEPTDILYFPYLRGSGAPHPDPEARGAFIGLTDIHTRGAMVQAVLEGTAYEMEAGRAAAEARTGSPIRRIVAAGGGTRNPHWVQIKADVAGRPIEILAVKAATVLGAALLAGLGIGIFADGTSAQASVRGLSGKRYVPNLVRHRRYQTLYAERYVPLREAVRTDWSPVQGT